MWEARSTDPALTSRQRARNRDLVQNAAGLINGIKFGISFLLHKDEDLTKDLPIKKDKQPDAVPADG
jgi:hypothetical protein